MSVASDNPIPILECPEMLPTVGCSCALPVTVLQGHMRGFVQENSFNSGKVYQCLESYVRPGTPHDLPSSMLPTHNNAPITHPPQPHQDKSGLSVTVLFAATEHIIKSTARKHAPPMQTLTPLSCTPPPPPALPQHPPLSAAAHPTPQSSPSRSQPHLRPRPHPPVDNDP